MSRNSLRGPTESSRRRSRGSARPLVTLAALVAVLASTLGAVVLPAQAAPPTTTVGLLASDLEPNIADVQSKLQGTASFAAVEVLDPSGVEAGVPSLSDLQLHDAVLVWTNFNFSDPDAVGDVLADYVDGGGRVVVAALAAEPDLLSIGGRFRSGDYLPVTTGAQGGGTRLFLVADLPGDPLLDGVTEFDGGSNSFHNRPLTVKPGATLVASWTSQQPLVVRGEKSIFLNFLPPSSSARDDYWNAATDGARLMANALNDGPAPEAPSFEEAQAACEPGGEIPEGYGLREGTNRNDTVRGTSGNDVLRGLGGNDTLVGLGGDDILCGGAGNDSLQGGQDGDFLFGGAGNDDLAGGAGDDVLLGAAGNDLLDGGGGSDVGLDTQGNNTFRSIESRTLEPTPDPDPSPTIFTAR